MILCGDKTMFANIFPSDISLQIFYTI